MVVVIVVIVTAVVTVDAPVTIPAIVEKKVPAHIGQAVKRPVIAPTPLK